MSYCVNCGVELEKGTASCPLCDTPVINPRESQDSEKQAYPEKIDIPKSVSKKYWGFILSLVVLIPNLVLIILNALFFDSGVIKYIVGACCVAWVWFLFPLFWKKPIPVILVGIDALALLAYLNTYRMYGDDNGWFSRIVMPAVIMLWAICNVFIFWLRKPRRKASIAIAVLISLNIMTFVVEICMNMFYNNRLEIAISLAMTACCIALIVFFIVLLKSKRLNEWFSRKFFM